METPALLRAGVLLSALAIAVVWWLQANYVKVLLVQSLDNHKPHGGWEATATVRVIVEDRLQADADAQATRDLLQPARYDRF